MSMQETTVVSWLKALSNPTRLRVFCLLCENGELCVIDLIDRLEGLEPHQQSGLSQHLAVMRREGVVETRRERQHIYYRINPERHDDVMEWFSHLKAA